MSLTLENVKIAFGSSTNLVCANDRILVELPYRWLNYDIIKFRKCLVDLELEELWLFLEVH